MIDLFSGFKPQYISPIKNLLDKYNINVCECDTSLQSAFSNAGYYIRDRIVNIRSHDEVFRVGHELAHIILINDFKRLLIDNWNLPLISKNFDDSSKKKMLLFESRVWGIENFLYISSHRKVPNFGYLELVSGSRVKINKEYKYWYDSSLEIMNRYEQSMTLDKFLNDLEVRFSFINNHILNNPGFNSKEFSLGL